MTHRDPARNGRGRYLAALAIVTPLGFLTKFYSGPGAEWVANHAGGFLYVVFWIALVLAIVPHLAGAAVAAGVLAATCALEFAQLWHPPWLEWVRSFFLGRALLGSTFSWGDFPYYAAGAVAGYAAARAVGSEPPSRD